MRVIYGRRKEGSLKRKVNCMYFYFPIRAKDDTAGTLGFSPRHKKFMSNLFDVGTILKLNLQPVYARWNFSRTNTQGNDLLEPSLDLDSMAVSLRSDHAVVSR